MENKEEILQALHEFERMADDDRSMSPELESVVSYIAKTGQVLFPWNSLKPLFMFKLDKVMRDFFESSPSRNSSSSEPTQTAEFEVMRQRLLDCFDTFTSAPFTVQRLCELMVEPRKHYHNSEKFMRGVEKNVLVVSTIDVEIENDRDGFFNNIDGAHTVPSLPAMNGPLVNGESVMTVAVSTAGQSVTTNRQSGSQDSSDSDRLSLHTPTENQQSSSIVTRNGDLARANNINITDLSHKSSIAENGENKAAEENLENQNEERILASVPASAPTSSEQRHSETIESTTEKDGTEVSTCPEELAQSEEDNLETSKKTSEQDLKDREKKDPVLGIKENENREDKKTTDEPMDTA